MNINEECLLKYLNNPQRLELSTQIMQDFANSIISNNKTISDNTLYLTEKDLFTRNANLKELCTA